MYWYVKPVPTALAGSRVATTVPSKVESNPLIHTRSKNSVSSRVSLPCQDQFIVDKLTGPSDSEIGWVGVVRIIAHALKSADRGSSSYPFRLSLNWQMLPSYPSTDEIVLT